MGKKIQEGIGGGEVDTRPEFFRLGEKPEIVEVPMDSYLIAGQMRAAHSKEKEDELRHNIESMGQMHTPIFLARSPFEIAHTYVEYTNECWGKNVAIPNNMVQPDGTVLILAAGHRRDRAYLEIAKARGYGRGGTLIDAQVFPCSSPEAIMRLQVSENFHDRPPAIQYARAVKEMYYIGSKEGRYSNIADFLPDSPLGESATRDALKYFQLPQVIRDHVDDGIISYNLATEFSALQSAVIDNFMRQRAAEFDQRDLSEEEAGDLLEVALLNADDIVKTELFRIVARLHPSIGELLDGSKRKFWSATKARDYIRSLVGQYRDHRQLELYVSEQSVLERQAEAWAGSVSFRKRVIVDASGQAIMAANALVEAGAHLPVEGRNLARILLAAQKAGSLGLPEAIARFGEVLEDEVASVHEHQSALDI